MSEVIRFYFDFLSPYSYLAVERIARTPRLAALPLVWRPVVFGTVLSRLETRGPGEIPVKRRHAVQDALLVAQALGVPLEGPPAHPFNSVYALRSVCAVEDEALRARLATRYFRAAWAEGQSLEDLAVLRRCLAELDIAQDPEEAATTAAHRAQLKANTAELLEAGGFGVPTFLARDALFFGQDRQELLARFWAGELARDRL